MHAHAVLKHNWSKFSAWLASSMRVLWLLLLLQAARTILELGREDNSEVQSVGCKGEGEEKAESTRAVDQFLVGAVDD